MKLLASTVISFTFGSEEPGLKPEAVELSKEQISIYEQLSQRIRTITDPTISEVEDTFERI